MLKWINFPIEPCMSITFFPIKMRELDKEFISDINDDNKRKNALRVDQDYESGELSAVAPPLAQF